jgi:flagellar biosynthesis protein FlhF
MKIKRFFAKDMRTALKEVKEELGPDAVIMSNKKLADGVEIVAAIDNDRAPVATPVQAQPAARPEIPAATTAPRFVRPEPARAKPEAQAQVADSLQALLERQTARPRSPELASMFSQSGIDTERAFTRAPQEKPTRTQKNSTSY